MFCCSVQCQHLCVVRSFWSSLLHGLLAFLLCRLRCMSVRPFRASVQPVSVKHRHASNHSVVLSLHAYKVGICAWHSCFHSLGSLVSHGTLFVCEGLQLGFRTVGDEVVFLQVPCFQCDRHAMAIQLCAKVTGGS